MLLLVGSGERKEKNFHTSLPSSIPSPSMSRSASSLGHALWSIRVLFVTLEHTKN